MFCKVWSNAIFIFTFYKFIMLRGADNHFRRKEMFRYLLWNIGAFAGETYFSLPLNKQKKEL